MHDKVQFCKDYLNKKVKFQEGISFTVYFEERKVRK